MRGRCSVAEIRWPSYRYRTDLAWCWNEEAERAILVNETRELRSIRLLFLVQKINFENERRDGLNILVENKRTNLVGSIQFDACPSSLHRDEEDLCA